MKKLLKSNKYKFRTLTIALLCLITLGLSAQVERDKRIEKTFSGKEMVSMEHRYGPLTVMAASDGQVRLEASIAVKAKNEEDAQSVLDHFDISISESGKSLLLKTDFAVSNWSSTNNSTKLKFDDGKKVSDLKDLEIKAVLYVPKLQELTLKNKYDNIDIQDNLTTDLNVELHSGRVKAGNIGGKLQLDMKYSKGTFGNFEDAQLALYDCELEFGSGATVSLSSKYSELQLGDVQSIDLEIYDDKIEIGNVAGNVTIIDKYSDVTLGNFESARMDVYDSDIVLENAQDIQIKSKYTTLKAKQVNGLHFELSYDDDLEAQRVGSLRADSKYSSFKIGVLEGGLQLTSYDDNLEIGKLTGPLENFSFSGKYTDLILNLNEEIKYHLEANLTYGKFTYPEKNFETQIYKEKNDKLEFKGKVKGTTEDSPKLFISSYDGNVVLQ